MKQEIMKKKQDKQFYLNRAIEDFRALVIYFNATRPRYDKGYFKNGKFDLKYMLHQMDFLQKWDTMPVKQKKFYANIYAKYSKTYNMVFGIPDRLIQKVLGEYKDDEGIRHKISIEEVVDHLVKQGFIKVVNAGKKFNRGDDGNYQVKCWWSKKYLLANYKYWLKLMGDAKYANIETFGSDRVKKAIFKWIEEYKKNNDSDNTKTQPTKGEIIHQVIVSLNKFGVFTPEQIMKLSSKWLNGKYTTEEVNRDHSTFVRQCTKKVLIERVLERLYTRLGFTKDDEICVMLTKITNIIED